MHCNPPPPPASPHVPPIADELKRNLGGVDLSSVFLAEGGGFVTGAVVGGHVLDKLPSSANPLLCVCLLGIAGATALVPVMGSVATLDVVIAVQGVFAGGLDTIIHPAMSWCVWARVLSTTIVGSRDNHLTQIDSQLVMSGGHTARLTAQHELGMNIEGCQWL